MLTLPPTRYVTWTGTEWAIFFCRHIWLDQHHSKRNHPIRTYTVKTQETHTFCLMVWKCYLFPFSIDTHFWSISCATLIHIASLSAPEQIFTKYILPQRCVLYYLFGRHFLIISKSTQMLQLFNTIKYWVLIDQNLTG